MTGHRKDCVLATIAIACAVCGCERTSLEVTGRTGGGAKAPTASVATATEPDPLPRLPDPIAPKTTVRRDPTNDDRKGSTENEPTEFVREKARAGVIDKEKYDPGIVTTPISAHFSLSQQMIFDFQIPKALELFEQLRNRKPNSHQEFMREIIQKGNIRLPTLPPYYRYIYDPEEGDFFIEHPADSN